MRSFKQPSAGAPIDCVLWELGRKDRQSSMPAAAAGGKKSKGKKKPHIFFTPACACGLRLSGRHA
jgi:hypothetical protein